MRILAPGYGIVYARCSDIVDMAPIPAEPRGAASRCRLTQLHVAFNKCDAGAFASIVRTVGSSLLALDVNAKYSRLVRTDDLKTILDTCRQLTMLRLRGAKIGSMDLFTHAYANEQCGITSLSLTNVYVSNTSLHSFARALANPRLRLSQTLTMFRYNFDEVGCTGESPRPDEDGIRLFLRMLASNATLSFFELALDKPYYSRFVNRFRDMDRQLLVTHASDLPRAQKLAFLSCVRVHMPGRHVQKRARSRGGVETAQSARVVLTREFVARIFLFARKRVYRVVSATAIVPEPQQQLVM